ncbi:hypothetical protein Pcinc_039371 [Petrolisthes cinctipes]|uniref:Bromodomain associated domain-containing protein n=1 Tax=Petrolisthes cinctipes TaxID=88211 RepID=A0AAE1EJ56_PETCI|nr:hypothetical protein Pcinc_039371 [Petrolisthes cinctipes]
MRDNIIVVYRLTLGMSCAGVHWGEEVDGQRGSGEDWGLNSADMEDLLTPKPPLPTSPALYQPSQEETPSFQILPGEFCRTDPLVMQTIRLLQHQRQVSQVISRVQSVGVEPGGSIPSCPPPPDDPVLERKTAKPHFLNFLPPENTAFTQGRTQTPVVEVEAATARLILRKAVAGLLAHTGYTDTSESVLRLLTDTAHQVLSRLCSVLRANTDLLLQTDRCPFHDVVEKTLHDVGLGSMSSLHQMYRDRVIQYHARVKQETTHLYHQYLNLAHTRDVAVSTPGSRRESMGEWWGGEEGGSGIGGGEEPSSVASIKSTSSLDHDPPVHTFSTLTQVGGEGEEGVQNSPAPGQQQQQQQYQVYPLTPR